MKTLIALCKMFLDIMLAVSIFILMAGIEYCAHVRHEIVATVIFWMATGVFVFTCMILLVAVIYRWFNSHYT